MLHRKPTALTWAKNDGMVSEAIDTIITLNAMQIYHAIRRVWLIVCLMSNFYSNWGTVYNLGDSFIFSCRITNTNKER